MHETDTDANGNITAGKRLVIQYVNGDQLPETFDHSMQLVGTGFRLEFEGQPSPPEDGFEYISEQVGPISVASGGTLVPETPIDNSDAAHLYVFGYLVDA